MNDKVEKTEGSAGEIVLYQPDEMVNIEVKLDVEHNTVWLTQAQMAELFGKERSGITKHIVNIFKEGELQEESNVSFFHIANSDKPVKFFSLNVIISVGYRVHSKQGTQFRIWATSVLREYLLRGYAVNQQLLAFQRQIDSRFDEHSGRLLKIETRLDRQQEDIDFYIKTNQQPSELVIPTGCVWDAYSYLSDLVRTAKDRVILIDNFVDDRTLLLLDKRASGVEATVYTRYSEKSELDFAKHNSQYEPVQREQLPHAVHDRYLIVDDNVWLLGSSVKDMGRALTTIIRTEINPEYILGCVKM